MRRGCSVLALAFLLAAAPASAGGGATRTTVTVWPQGKERGRPSRTWTLACNPARGTHPNPSRACASLLAHRALLRPLPRRIACTQVYGGPQVGRIDGVVAGKRVRVTYTRANGCEIARWNALRPVLSPRV